MITCPHCQKQTDDTNNFCEHCFEQVKCMSCGTILKAQAPICLKCGLSVGSQAPAGAGASPNTILLEEKVDQDGDKFSSSKRLEVGLTDLAVPTLGALFVNGISSGLNRGVTVAQSAGRIVGPVIPEPASHILMQGATPVADEPTSAPEQTAEHAQAPRSTIEDVFTINSAGELVCHTPDFKGSNKKEQQKRFVLLASYALEHFQNAATTKANINKVARAANIFDDNLRHYVKAQLAEHYFDDGDDSFRLSKSGKELAEKYMAEMNNPGIEAGARYWEPSAKSGKSLATKKHDQEQVTAWLATTSKLDAFNVTQLNHRQHVVFAYWLITNALGLAKSAQPATAFEFYRQKYQTVPITREQFSKEASRPASKKMLGHTPEGHYYTLEAGNTMAADLAKAQGFEPPYTTT